MTEVEFENGTFHCFLVVEKAFDELPLPNIRKLHKLLMTGHSAMNEKAFNDICEMLDDYVSERESSEKAYKKAIKIKTLFKGE